MSFFSEYNAPGDWGASIEIHQQQTFQVGSHYIKPFRISNDNSVIINMHILISQTMVAKQSLYEP